MRELGGFGNDLGLSVEVRPLHLHLPGARPLFDPQTRRHGRGALREAESLVAAPFTFRFAIGLRQRCSGRSQYRQCGDPGPHVRDDGERICAGLKNAEGADDRQSELCVSGFDRIKVDREAEAQLSPSARQPVVLRAPWLRLAGT